MSACPYKKPYYNWNTGKSEKCIFCYPRTETAQANACAHSCTGRIRFVGALLYDADRIEETAKLPDNRLVEGMREMVLDPNDPKVIEAARKKRHRRELDKGRAAVPFLHALQEVEDSVPSSSGIQDGSDELLRAAAFADTPSGEGRSGWRV